MFYTRPAVWKKFGSQVKVAHFAGLEKPWKHRLSANDGAICQALDRLESSDTIYTTAEQSGIVALWWAVFFKRVKNRLGNGMFLSTTFEPIPPPPPPPSPQDNRPEDQEFRNQNERYHPEFDDNSFHFLHTNQRVDESNRYEKYHEFFEPLKQPEPEHHKYYESLHHQSHGHQPPVYNEHHQCHHNECHYQPPQSEPPSSSQPQSERHDFHHQHHQENRHEEPQEWSQDPPQRPHSEHHNQSGRQPSPQRHCETSPPTPPLPPPPPEPRNDKDPLFFVKKPMCRECLRELQWSRQFFDFLRRDIPISMSPTYSGSRLRLRSQPKTLPGEQPIRGVLKNSPTPPTFTIHDEESSEIGAKEQRKRERKVKKGLHQVHKGKSAAKKRLKRPVDSSKLVDAAKRGIQAKMESASPTGETLVNPREKIKTFPIKNYANKEKEPRSEEMLDSILRSALIKRSEVSEVNQLEEAQPRLGTVTPPASVTRAKRQIKPLSDSEKAEVEALIRLKIDRAVADRGSMELPEREEGINPKSHSELEAKPGLNKATEKTSKKAKDLKVPSLSKAEEMKTESMVEEDLQNIPALKSKIERPKQKPEPKERMKKKVNNVETRSKQVVEKPVRDSTPWLPRAKKSRFGSQKFSDSEYFCDRHRPHPPPPQWRMFAWERGEIDYMGSDRFSNILARIRSTIQQSSDDALPIGIWL
ncbi:unnamed protein product [Rodentolepis nana]|uniref:PWWP domain-containing protein n=1 Tax=Rodentolepis nana TaxID=102285 RepID=A0A158QIJ1_RODNA|nr:unnamed protein product [Rodentolepis nana]